MRGTARAILTMLGMNQPQVARREPTWSPSGTPQQADEANRQIRAAEEKRQRRMKRNLELLAKERNQ